MSREGPLQNNPEGVSLQPIQHSLAVPSRAGRLLNIATRPPRWGWAAGCPHGDVRSGFPRLCPWLGGYPPEGGFCRHVVGLVPRARPCSCYPSVFSCPQLVISLLTLCCIDSISYSCCIIHGHEGLTCTCTVYCSSLLYMHASY